MADVWYIGDHQKRTITLGGKEFEWNIWNGWSIPESAFTSQQLMDLDADPGFLLGQNGPRVTPPWTADPVTGRESVYLRRMEEIYNEVPARLSKAALDATYAPSGYALKQLAANPDQLAVGAITRSASGAATGFSVAWPDGATGAFTGTESTTFPGAIDTYAITHVLEGVTITYTQPALTRDTTGAVTARPAIVVS